MARSFFETTPTRIGLAAIGFAYGLLTMAPGPVVASEAAQLQGAASGSFSRLVNVFGQPDAASQGQTYQVAQQSANDNASSAWQATAGQAAEWKDQFDSTGGGGAVVSSSLEASALLGEHAVPELYKAIDRYQRIAQAGGWNEVPKGPTMRVGSRHRNVEAVRARLVVTGDLAVGSGQGSIFDSYVEDAVRRFQARHGIVPSGVVREDTRRAMNVPVSKRLSMLRANLDRFASRTDDLNGRYIAVNVPGAEIEAVDNGFVVSRHTAVVGKIDRQTPLLSSRTHEINFNPYWTVPKSIIRRDVIPTVLKDPTYLKRYNIRILDNAGDEIDPLQVNWQTDEAVDYMFRQDPGEVNSLGTVKINFHNTHQVYLHDTPSKSLFARSSRFHSSGCVRVQNVRELVSWILRDTESWDRSKVDSIIRVGERLDVQVTKPPKLHLVYFTAWANTNGTVHFRDDIYNLDSGPQTAAVQQ